MPTLLAVIRARSIELKRWAAIEAAAFDAAIWFLRSPSFLAWSASSSSRSIALAKVKPSSQSVSGASKWSQTAAWTQRRAVLVLTLYWMASVRAAVARVTPSVSISRASAMRSSVCSAVDPLVRLISCALEWSRSGRPWPRHRLVRRWSETELKLALTLDTWTPSTLGQYRHEPERNQLWLIANCWLPAGSRLCSP